MENLDDKNLEEYIKKLMFIPLVDLRVMHKEKTEKENQLKAQYNDLIKNIDVMKATIQKLDEKRNLRKIFREDGVVEKLERNNMTLGKKLVEIEKEKEKLRQNFSEIIKRMEKVDKIIEEQDFEIHLSTEEGANEIYIIQTKTKQAEAELVLKRESLAANKQVLESKVACLERDKQELQKFEKEMEELMKNETESKLNAAQKEEESLKNNIIQSNAEIENLTATLCEIEEKFTSLTKDAEDLPQQLENQLAINEKLKQELQNEEDLLMTGLKNLAKQESNMAMQENLEFARIVKDDLFEIDQLTEAIKRKKAEMDYAEEQIVELTIELNQTNQKIEYIDGKIFEQKQFKKTLYEKIIEQLKFINNKSNEIAVLKARIEDLGKRENETKAQNILDEALKLGNMLQMDIDDPDEMDLFFTDDESSSSSCSTWNFSVSSYDGSRPDLANIIANLSSINDNFVSSTDDMKRLSPSTISRR